MRAIEGSAIASKILEEGVVVSLHWFYEAPAITQSKFQLMIHVRILDDRQITHLICVRLKLLLYDFFRLCFGPSK